MNYLLVAAVCCAFWGCSNPRQHLQNEACDPSVEECFDPAASMRFNSILERLRQQVPDPFPELQEDAYCSVKTLPIEKANPQLFRFNHTFPFSRGSDSFIYKSIDTIEGRHLVAKTVSLNSPEMLQSLLREKALLRALFEKKIFSIVPGLFSNLCEIFVMVSELVGEKPIAHAGPLLSQNPALLARTAAAAIKLLKEIHDKGFVHGDIHGDNFVYSGDNDAATIPESLALIDFGRTEVFIDRFGRHIPESKKEYANWLNLDILSPFELQGWYKTRRDDIFRLAEILLLPFGIKEPEKAMIEKRDENEKETVSSARTGSLN